MREVEPNLEIDDRLTDHTEAKGARLNNPGMAWTDGNFISALALEPGGGKMEGGHRYDCRIFARDFLGGMHEPVLASIGEEVSNLEDSFVRSIVRYHEYKFRAEVSAQEPSQPPRCAASDAAMQFVATLDMGVRCLALEVLCQR